MLVTSNVKFWFFFSFFFLFFGGGGGGGENNKKKIGFFREENKNENICMSVKTHMSILESRSSL